MALLPVEDVVNYVERLTTPAKCPWTGVDMLALESNTKGRLKTIFKWVAAGLRSAARDARTTARDLARRFVQALVQRCSHRCAKVRMMVFQVIEYLLGRSAPFRNHFFDQFGLWYLHNLCGIGKPLSTPTAISVGLSARAITALRTWAGLWGALYIKLDLARQFLERELASRNYHDLSTRAERRERLRLVQLRRQQRLVAERCRQMQREAPEFVAEVGKTLKELRHVFQLLIPTLDLTPAGANADSSDPPPTDLFSVHGLGSVNYRLEISLRPAGLTETPATTPLFDVIRDSLRLITTRFLPRISAWEHLLSRHLPPHNSPQDHVKRQWQIFLTKLRTRLRELQQDCSLFQFLPPEGTPLPVSHASPAAAASLPPLPSVSTTSSPGLSQLLRTLNASDPSTFQAPPSLFDIIDARARQQASASRTRTGTLPTATLSPRAASLPTGGDELLDADINTDADILDFGLIEEDLEEDGSGADSDTTVIDELDDDDLLLLRSLHPTEIVAQFNLQPPPPFGFSEFM
jgi:hypothetical protein